jgi:hypothetical protein
MSSSRITEQFNSGIFNCIKLEKEAAGLPSPRSRSRMTRPLAFEKSVWSPLPEICVGFQKFKAGTASCWIAPNQACFGHGAALSIDEPHLLPVY